MRYGLISNYRRSWSKIGKRTELKNQQAYVNQYLYSCVSPISGESFHIFSLSDANGSTLKVYLEELKKHYLEKGNKKHLIIVLDNAPFHKLKVLQDLENITFVFLPSYSPQLNPAERFFEEMRKGTANQLFETIEDQEEAITKKILEYDEIKTKTLTGYEWILRQWERVF